MNKQIINKDDGSLTLHNGFVITQHTTLAELQSNLINEKLKKCAYAQNCFILPQTKYGEYYIIFWFHFKDDKIYKISFEIETAPIERIPWSNQRDLETNWIAEQMDDKQNFIWDMNIAGRNYYLAYPWGSIGVYYDFKNGTFDSGIFYNTKFQNQ